VDNGCMISSKEIDERNCVIVIRSIKLKSCQCAIFLKLKSCQCVTFLIKKNSGEIVLTWYDFSFCI